ncbi:hypothetical protein HDV03_003707 [Kappamyces sp. JEL0829]|nr:hypothetical protein HDV03_003707 [Kappamyces sp. JEL0829]
MSSISLLRSRQIQTLAPYQPKDVGNGNLQITCHLSSGIAILNLYLSPLFPQEPPVITVQPSQLSHAMINQGTVRHDKLSRWQPSSSLGGIVEDIMVEFSMQPPVLPAAQSPHQQQPRPAPQIPPNATRTAPQPTIDIPGLETKTAQELQELLSDNFEFAEFFYGLQEVATTRKVQEELIVQNAKVAQTSMSRTQEIQNLKQRVQALQEQNAEQRKKIDQLLIEQQQELVRFGSEYVTEQLRQLVATSDDMTDLCASSYLEGKLSEEEFIKAFKEARKLYHSRAGKLETLQGPSK